MALDSKSPFFDKSAAQLMPWSLAPLDRWNLATESPDLVWTNWVKYTKHSRIRAANHETQISQGMGFMNFWRTGYPVETILLSRLDRENKSRSPFRMTDAASNDWTSPRFEAPRRIFSRVGSDVKSRPCVSANQKPMGVLLPNWSFMNMCKFM